VLTDAKIDSLRNDTPGCAERRHFNHAGASLPPRRVTEAIIDHLMLESMRGPMEAAALVTDELAMLRTNAAKFIGAEEGEVALGGSGSALWGNVFASLPPLRSGDRILIGRQEWGGNVASMQRAASHAGASIETIPCMDDGSVDANALSAIIDDRVALISLTWLPANGGLINDAEAIGRVANAAGVPYFVDAGQALGQLPIDVSRIGCDVLKAAGRKYVRGPRGTALLYVRSKFLEKLNPSFVDVSSGPLVNGKVELRDDARLFETSEAPISLLLGLGAAIALASELGVEAIQTRIALLATQLREGLKRIPAVEVRDLGTKQSGLVSFTVEGISASVVRSKLAEKSISIGANGIPYTPFDMTARGLQEIARASVSYFNTAGEVDGLVYAVEQIAKDAIQ
jgi:selenocysteine lyase/cysteine desulfurase